ncbi:hypothetical protein, partial [Oxalobacter formigenes]
CNLANTSHEKTSRQKQKKQNKKRKSGFYPETIEKHNKKQALVNIYCVVLFIIKSQSGCNSVQGHVFEGVFEMISPVRNFFAHCAVSGNFSSLLTIMSKKQVDWHAITRTGIHHPFAERQVFLWQMP